MLTGTLKSVGRKTTGFKVCRALVAALTELDGRDDHGRYLRAQDDDRPDHEEARDDARPSEQDAHHALCGSALGNPR